MSNNQERAVEKYKTQVQFICLEKLNEEQTDNQQEKFEKTEIENDKIDIKVRENDDSECEWNEVIEEQVIDDDEQMC